MAEAWRERVRRSLGRQVPTGGSAWQPDGGPLVRSEPEGRGPVPLAALLRSMEAVRASRVGDGGHECWRMAWQPRRLPAPDWLGGRLSGAVRSLSSRGLPEACHPDLRLLVGRQAQELAVFDLETLGLGNAGVFLAGFLSVLGAELAIEQFFAADYSEEGAVIAAFEQRLRARPVLVSFNGKAYDLPLLAGRAGLWRVNLAPAWDLDHVDILYECRRRWSGGLPDCRLRTLERHLCGRERSGDIPGHRIPALYHEFVASQDARIIEPVLIHNVLDLVTVAEVLLACVAGEGA